MSWGLGIPVLFAVVSLHNKIITAGYIHLHAGLGIPVLFAVVSLHNKIITAGYIHLHATVCVDLLAGHINDNKIAVSATISITCKLCTSISLRNIPQSSLKQWCSQAGAHWGTCPSNQRPCSTKCRRACKLSTTKVPRSGAKIHKGLESSSANSYLYPQKSRAVRSGERKRLSYYNEVRSPDLTAREFAESNEVTLHHAQIRRSGSAPDSRRRYGLK